MYYHGTSSAVISRYSYMLLPPTETGVIQESGRKKNLNKVFFTTDIRSAKIYAGRSVSRFGGKPVIYRVIPMSKTEVINELHGSSVYCCDWGFIEEVK